MPLENFKVAKIGGTMQYATIDHVSTRKEESARYRHMIIQTMPASHPRCKSNEELSSLFYLDNLPFLERITKLSNPKAIWKKATENMTFKSEIKMTGIKEVFKATKKGRQFYKN